MFRLLMLLTASFMYSALAHATIIGDVLTVTRLYPDRSTVFLNQSGSSDPVLSIPGFVVVTAKTGPDNGASPQPTHYSIDFEANSIVFDFLNSSEFAGKPGPLYGLSNPFDGLRFTGFADVIKNVSVIFPDTKGINIVDLAWADHSIDLNLGGKFDSNAAIKLKVEFLTQSVPEPGSLALVSIAGVAALRHRRKWLS